MMRFTDLAASRAASRRSRPKSSTLTLPSCCATLKACLSPSWCVTPTLPVVVYPSCHEPFLTIGGAVPVFVFSR